MPLYEFVCTRCPTRFEALAKVGEVPPCPACGAKKPERLISAASTPKSSVAAARHMKPVLPAGCGTCGDPRGPGACKT